MRSILPTLLFYMLLTLHYPVFSQAALSESLLQKIGELDQNYYKAQQKGDLNEQSRWLNKKAFLYWDNELFKKAIETFELSVQLNEQLGNENGVASIEQQIGIIYADLQDYDRSLIHFKKALNYSRFKAPKKTVANSLINVAVAHLNLEQYTMASENLEEALDLFREMKDLGMVKSCCAMLAENYEKLGNAEKSIEYFNLYAALEKKLQKEQIARKEQETEKKIGQMQVVTQKAIAEKEEKEKALLLANQALRLTEALNSEKEARIEVLNKEKELKDMILKEKEARLKNELLMKNSFIGGFLLVGLLAFFLSMGYYMKKKANEKLSEQNIEILQQKEEISYKSTALQAALSNLKSHSLKITQSINYAKRIQNAMLPGEDELKKLLPDSFILFKPRDIVSGDFYWFGEIKAPLNDEQASDKKRYKRKLAISAIDCTGHGVPGAFMSIIGYNLIEEIVSHGVHRSGDILNQLHAKVFRALKQNSTDNKDGMDMALCVIDPEKKEMEFSGAVNPMVYIREGKLHYIKGNRIGIGGKGYGKKPEFDTHKVPLDLPVSVYLYSDGYQDQFGGENKKKFMSRRLRNLIFTIHEKPMEEQKKVLDQTIENWRKEGQEIQVDDILVMGFHIDPTKL